MGSPKKIIPYPDFLIKMLLIATVSTLLYLASAAPSVLDGLCPCLDSGIDYWGADIKRLDEISTIVQCVDECKKEATCVSVTHRPSTKDCWLKNKDYGKDGKSVLDTVNSINMRCVLANVVGTGCVKMDYDFLAADIRMVPNVADMPGCIAECVAEPACVSVTHQPSSLNCWLKNQVSGATPGDKTGVNSRNLDCSLPVPN